MNLTKYHKQAIVKSILNDLPTINEDVLHRQIQNDLVGGMSQEAQALYCVTPGALATATFDSSYGFAWGKRITIGDADWKTITSPYLEAQTARDGIRISLKTAIEGIRTRKQFIDTFPEFSHYAPPEAGKSSNLPAIANLVADLVKAGWVQKVSQA